MQQFVVGADHLSGSQVDAAQDDVRLAAGLHVGLQGLLPVELDSQVDHVAALNQAEGGRVGPASGNVDAHRTACPYNLVVTDSQPGMLLLCLQLADDALSEESEGLVALAAEHSIVDARHQRSVRRERRRQGNGIVGKTAGGIVEV